MWATNNSHEQLVKILMEAGASSTTKSAKGRTVFDFINTENQKLVDILAIDPRDSVSSTSSLFYRTTSSVSSASTENDFYYHQPNDETQEEVELRKKLFEDTMTLANDYDQDEEDDDDDDDNDQLQDNIFYWDTCRPDQMFVFNSNDLDGILDLVINKIEFPLKNQQDIHVPSNVIFLSARFAHYFSSDELLYQVLEGSLTRISTIIKV